MHIHLGSPNPAFTQGLILDLARAGKLAGATIINDVDFANQLVQYLPYVVLRFCWSDHDNPTQDFQFVACDPRIILQWGNEANVPDDTFHWLRQMVTADAYERKVVILNDSVGWTEDITWFARRPALEYARDHGHYVGLHAYGDVTKGDNNYCPMIDPMHPDAERWFWGRWEHLYSLMPDVQPPLILTEAGSGGFQTNATVEQWLADIQRVKDRVSSFPFLKSWHLWTVGGQMGFGFDRDSLDNWLAYLQ